MQSELQQMGSKVIQTDTNSSNGQNKCPKCGATEITLNPVTGKLRCDFCRHEFEPIKLETLEEDLSMLEGQVIGSGAQDIIPSTNEIMTFKCSSCGAEVVVDTANSMQARCHWCRNILSVNEQIPNGAIPDFVLPFKLTKEEAKKQIETFVRKRKFFAHPKFKAEFCLDNIMGVYFPYMVVDINASASFEGEGSHITKKYMKRDEMVYDADIYHFKRDFDVLIQGLTIESNKERLNKLDFEKTNNVINAIMPFDVENGVQFNANYLKGYTSERRNMNVEELQSVIKSQAKDVARFAVKETLKEYDASISMSKENLNIKGSKWTTAYLPVWLYSYQQIKGKNKVLHYVAVNARTKETMGSVPIHYPKLVGLSILLEIIGIIVYLSFSFPYSWLCLLVGILYFLFIFFRYRNTNARHEYEKDTKKNVNHLIKEDNFLKSVHASKMGNNLAGNLVNMPLKFDATIKKISEIQNEIQKKESEK